MNSVSIHTVFLALGTNVGDRIANLSTAQRALNAIVTIQKCSSIYETPPWGYSDQPTFLNQVVEGVTQESPWELLAFLKQVEFEMGRTQTIRNGPRVIDLDLLFYDDLVLESALLTIPHPRMEGRAFVWLPLADIAPDFIHPISGKTVKDIVKELDTTGINLYSAGCTGNTNSNEISPPDK